MLDVIGRNGTRLRGLIEDLLVLNKIESGGLHVGARRTCGLGELVQHTVEELSPVAGRGRVRARGRATRSTAWSSSGDRGQLRARPDQPRVQRHQVHPGRGAGRAVPRGAAGRAGPAGRGAAALPDTGHRHPRSRPCRSCSRGSSARATPPPPPSRAPAWASPSSRRSSRATAASSTSTSVEGEGTMVVIELPLVPAACRGGECRTRPAVYHLRCRFWHTCAG